MSWLWGEERDARMMMMMIIIRWEREMQEYDDNYEEKMMWRLWEERDGRRKEKDGCMWMMW